MVVHAGAGFGKTTLASQWAQRDPRPHLLVRIAPFLDDPAALAFALIDAFESVGPVAGETRAAVTGAEPGFSALLLPAMTRLAASRERDFVLVVDDIQLLTRRECHALLQAIAEGVPDGSQVALLSRLEPPSWLRGRGPKAASWNWAPLTWRSTTTRAAASWTVSGNPVGGPGRGARQAR